MKEIAYIHAEAYPAGESKHGPIALVEPRFPTIFTSVGGEDDEMLHSNVQEMKTRGAFVITVAPKGSGLNAESDHAFCDAQAEPPCSPDCLHSSAPAPGILHCDG